MQTIYERLGDVHLRQLVDAFYDRVLEDERINHLFTTDIELVKSKQYRFLTQFLGGPARYSELYGHPKLRMRHLPHKITLEGALAWLECMRSAINTLPIEEPLKEELFMRFPQAARHMVNTESA